MLIKHICYSLLCVLILCTSLSVQSSCHDSRGRLLPCNARKCPKNLQCKGNVGKDNCNCCIVCLQQENEKCGPLFGECDHHAPYCEVLGKSNSARCITEKTALLYKIPKYTNKIRECKNRRQQSLLDLVRCMRASITYYCKKNPDYIPHKDCCLGTGGGDKCNPNADIYEELNVDVTLQFMEPVEKTKSKR